MNRFLHCITLIVLMAQVFRAEAQEYNFRSTVYYYRLPNDSLVSSGLTLATFNFNNASRQNDSLFQGGIYFPANDCFGHNIWIRLRHIAEDPNGTSRGINVPATAANPCQSNIMLGGWAGFLYDFEIYNDQNITGAASYFLGNLFPTSITVASLETLSGTCGGSEWLSFKILDTSSTGWDLNSINFTGSNGASNPAFSDSLAVYTTGGCFPPDGFSYTFTTGADSISFINGSQTGYTEFKMSAGNVSHFQYGYEYIGLTGGYQGMSMAFGSAPTYTFTTTDVTCKNGSDGAINVTISGGIGPFSYLWNNGTTSGTSIQSLMAGTYTLTVTDQNGCGAPASTTITIQEPQNVSVTLDSSMKSNVTCYNAADGTLQVYSNGTGTVNYLWNTGATTNALTNLTPGLYTVTISDLTTCLVYRDSISEPAAIDTSVTVSGNTLISNSQGSTYQWINCLNNSPFVDSTFSSFTPTSSGSYKVAINKNGCIDTSACVSITISGLNDQSTASEFYVYTSSADNTLYIHLNGILAEKLIIYNINGQVIYQGSYTSDQPISLSNVANGIYFFEIATSTKQFKGKWAKW